MKITISFARELTLNAINGVARYYDTLESQLQLAKTEELEWIRGTIKSMALDLEQEREEWNIARQEHEMTFEMLLPNLFRYSCMVLLYLVVEHELGEISKAVQQKRENLPQPPHPKSNVVAKYKEYITHKAGIQGLQWDTLHNLNKIRNCIVHASGKVKGYRQEAELRQIAKTVPGISISGETSDSPDDLQPLYLEDDMLMLRPEYCRQAINDVYKFFEQLCDAIPLPRLMIESESE